MDKNKQSYFASDKERMFHMENNNSSGADNKNDRDNKNDEITRLYRSLNKELKKRVNDEEYEEIKQKADALLLTLAQKMEKECEEEIERQKHESATLAQEMKKKYEEKNRKQKNNRRKVIITSLILFMIVIILFEYVFTDPNFILTTIWGSVGSIITIIVETYFINKKDIAYIREDDEPITTGIANVVSTMGQTIKEASLLHLFMLLWGTIMLGEFFGSMGAVEVVCEFAAAGFTAVRNKDEDVILATRVDVEIEDNILAGNIFAEYDKTTIKMLQQADITQAELNIIKKLSQEDYELVFFLNLEDIDWTDQNAVNEAVLQMIDEIRSIQMENVFDKGENDGGAPQWLCDLVHQASEDEKKAKSFSAIVSIRDVRAGAFTLFPKRSLANLLSNNYQELAIILFLNGGNEEAIVYYYSQSIIRDFECLQFAENSNDMVKDKLISIAQRYEDMIYTCPNMEDRQNAQTLAVAFKNAANEY